MAGALLQLQLIGEEYDWLASGHIEVIVTVIGCDFCETCAGLHENFNRGRDSSVVSNFFGSE